MRQTMLIQNTCEEVHVFFIRFSFLYNNLFLKLKLNLIFASFAIMIVSTINMKFNKKIHSFSAIFSSLKRYNMLFSIFHTIIELSWKKV
jgi:hypothetical protein